MTNQYWQQEQLYRTHDQSSAQVTWLPLGELEIPLFLSLTTLVFGEIFANIIKATSATLHYDYVTASV